LNRRRGFVLIEIMVAVLFVGIFMLALLQIRNQTLHHFNRSGDQHTGAWLAEMKMAELVSQDLPDPENQDMWYLQGDGDFGDFNDRYNEVNRSVNEGWTDRAHFSKFEYEWTKELLFIGPNFIGNKEDLDNWEQPLDEFGEPVAGEDNPMEQPAARVVRITLIVWLPELPSTEAESETAQARPSVKLVTYVDPATLFNGEPEEETPPEEP